MVDELSGIGLVELHQHLDGSIPAALQWEMMCKNGLNPVATEAEMERLLIMQEGEEGTLLQYLNKLHYPLWITQFYENLREVSHAVLTEAYANGVRLLELRYAPIIHTYGGLTLRQAIRAILSGLNAFRRDHPDFQTGLIVIAMRQHGPHIANILARQAVGEAQHLHRRSGVIGFDIAGMEAGCPPHLFREAYDIARSAGLGLTAHAGEDEGPDNVWQAIDDLGVGRVGHGCAAVADRTLLARLQRDGTVVECCLSSNYQTGAVRRGDVHPIVRFLEAGVRVSLCCDNSTVSATHLGKESALAAELVGWDAVREIHRRARDYSFIDPSVAGVALAPPGGGAANSRRVAPQPPPPSPPSPTETT